MGVDSFFVIFSILFFVAFFAVFLLILVTVIRGLRTEHANHNAPRLSVSAKVIAKRTQVGHHMNSVSPHMAGSSYTHYYVTVEFESGDRLELQVPAAEFGYLVEGDKGTLTFQGTRFLQFSR